MWGVGGVGVVWRVGGGWIGWGVWGGGGEGSKRKKVRFWVLAAL